MKLILESSNILSITKLPMVVDGNYWIMDENSKKILNVESENGKWLLKSNSEIKILNSLTLSELDSINYFESVFLEENNYYIIYNINSKEKWILYTVPLFENFENFVIDYNKIQEVSIGNIKNNNTITLNNDLFNDGQLVFKYDNGKISVNNLSKSKNMFINNTINKQKILINGDIIFINGIYIYFFGCLLLISNNKNDLLFDSIKIQKRLIQEHPEVEYSNNVDVHIDVFDKSNYFERPPRFKRNIEEKVINIDPPTQKENQVEMPLIFTIAPMITMGMTSLITGVTALQRVLEGKSTIKNEFSSLLMCGCMMISMIIFPLAQKFYTKTRKKEKEKKRRKKYKAYVDTKRTEIFNEINYQKQVLIEDNISVENVRKTILSSSRNLWNRKSEHNDFLNLRLGIGTLKPKLDIKYPQEKFTLEEDDLKDIVKGLVEESKDIVDVPIALNFKENNKVGIIANDNMLYNFFDNLLLQIIAFHGYDMLKIIILTDESKKNYWDKYRSLPYLWNNDRTLRFYANKKDSINKLTGLLMEEYNYRVEISKESRQSLNFNPYYVIFTDDIKHVKNNVFIKELLENKNNLCYSLIMGVEKLDDLPNECSMFINLDSEMSGLFTNSMTQESQQLFKADIVDFSINECLTAISNIPIDIANGKFILPKKYGFLEMYDVGNVNQLNIENRWKNNDIIHSLVTPVGIDEQGEIFTIDLHEKAHGPHGLVAGMTGSGKSEWIITFILSMALNYSPEEVQFVLIDYKGGGLALTFDDRENNIKLPHVVGTITNLDAIEIKRSLASIESELKRRQSMFKKAREALNESSMDIYKYQELYRAGKLEEPMSHLFIISDEFAELKAQQPDFMDELISTARIGRSLGVHLILATQKPSGVVNDQIWSNSKFKVCLKVQDKSDSNDMLKRPDAAMLKETGRFYLQVGFNEFFAKGQSAYAGGTYYESDKKIKIVDSTIDFLDDMGMIIKKGDIQKKNTQFVAKGEELPNVLNYIIENSKKLNLKINPLWLTRIPNLIYVDKLKEKYNYVKEDNILNPVIGEYDYPSKQMQGLLTLPLSKEGNVLIYGSSGSGKEKLLTTIIYSLMTCYQVQEVNIYVLDFGSQILTSFKMGPHIGDIITSSEEEKIENLFKFINNELNYRRNKFSNYNGNYLDYIKNTKDNIPNLVFIINSFEVFADLYDKFLDPINEFTRDCTRYGIYFILTSSSSNGIRNKIKQNFKTSLVLQMNDEGDYRTILGNNNGVMPSKAVGRGIIKLDNVVEFQTAYAYNEEVLYDNIKSLCLDLFSRYKMKALPIAVLPEVVTFKDVVKEEICINKIPVGLSKESLNIASINLLDNISYLISSRIFDDLLPFIDKFLLILDKTKKFSTFVLDYKFVYEDKKFLNISYLNNNFNTVLNKINDYSEKLNEVLVSNNDNVRSVNNYKDVVCVIIGVEKFISMITSEEKKIFDNIISKTKDSNKIHFILVDSANSLRKKEFESWYKETVDSSSGLWIGDGFAEQFTIKPSKQIQSYYKLIGNKYGYVVKNGSVDLIKVVDKE